MLLELILSSSAMITPAFADVDPSDLAAVNAANLSGPAPTVCVNPVEHALLAPDDKESVDIETPIGKVDAIARDISFIKNAVDAGKDVAKVNSTTRSIAPWFWAIIGALGGFAVCLVAKLWSRFVSFISAINAVIKEIDAKEKQSSKEK